MLNKIISVEVNDINGMTVHAEKFTANDNNSPEIKLNINSKLPRGMYMVSVDVEGEKMIQKLVVE